MSLKKLSLSFLQIENHQIWVQALGRSLCQIGYGLIFFYLPLVFVNRIGMSATAVGLSLGLSSLAGVLGHIAGGILVDSPQVGRKATLSLSVILGTVVSFFLAVTSSLPMLIAASLLLGLSVGFYWTAADAAVMDVTGTEDRHQAFAIMSVAENLGVGVGILGGGLMLTLVNRTPQLLFVGCGVIFLAFLAILHLTMTETRQPHTIHDESTHGILIALKDKSLIIFVLANVLFTTYIALVTSTLPLYFTNFIPNLAIQGTGAVADTATLFTWGYIGVGALLQLPIAHLFKSCPRVRVLMIAMLTWAAGFVLIWFTGAVSNVQFAWEIFALCLLSIASVIYKPFAAAIVAELAPPSLRGAYVAISSQCWALGYFIGPILGGWSMDQPAAIAHGSWLVIATSTVFGLAILFLFERFHQHARTAHPV